MRVLLLNPEDRPFDGHWMSEAWDLVVDFGWAGSCAYAEWAKVFRCPTFGLFSLGEEIKDVQGIAETLRVGRGQLVDVEGIDWWELIAPAEFPRLQEQLLLVKLRKLIPSEAEVRASSPHRLVAALEVLHNSKIRSYIPGSNTGIRGNVKRARWLHPLQIMRIALDKWDNDFHLRRFVSPRTKKSKNVPRVLLPSSYVNVSRVLCAYANTLPDRQFLLATTRSNGQLRNCPPNVKTASLASFAPIPRPSSTEKEISHLQEKWQRLRKELLASENWRQLIKGGCYGEFPKRLRNSLRIRDAWRQIFDREAIEAVLCGDENNYSNRVPVLLAKNRNVATVSCSHGALDMNLIIGDIASDVYLARGEMEMDYMLHKCALPPERVELGLPRISSTAQKILFTDRNQVVLFSEQYELYGGRVDLFYADVLPRLASVARSQQKKVVVKLHPFENLKLRTKQIERILPPEYRDYVRITNEPLTDAFLDRTWFALTVESSVAVDCALRGVPCFLCRWYELGLYGYGRQYEKYEAAAMLQTPEEILEIPAILSKVSPRRRIPPGLVRTVKPERLDELLRGKRNRQPASVAK